MKKLLLILSFLLITNSAVFADEIIDAKGTITPCHIETVMGGLVEYKKDGNLYSFARAQSSPVFNDYVDVKTNLLKRDSISRFFGKVIIKDMWGLTLNNENGNIKVPFYKVKFVGIYKP